MQLITVYAGGEGLPKEFGSLADEFQEDPHCALVITAIGDDGGSLISVWSDEVAADVVAGLSEQLPGMKISRREVIAGLSAWQV